MKYKFKAKDIKTGEWVEGDLAYVRTTFEPYETKPAIVKHYIYGECIYIGERRFVDENTIELIKEE